jgi:hypothetical protein
MASRHRLSEANRLLVDPNRRLGAPVRRGFVLASDQSGQSPLSALMSSQRSSGGRGGKQRLALLLTALWVAARPPFTVSHAASWWADMLAFEDPRSRAATRSVNQNLKVLAERKHIVLTPGRAGYSPTVEVLSELGTQDPYSRPKGSDGDVYFRVPHTLWTTGRIGDLDGPGLAMYVILLSRYIPSKPRPVWFSDRAFRDAHGFSENTRLSGLNQLVNLGMASMEEEYVDAPKLGGGYGTTRRRLYMLTPQYAPVDNRSAKDRTADTAAEESGVQFDEFLAGLAESNRWPPIDSESAASGDEPF